MNSLKNPKIIVPTSIFFLIIIITSIIFLFFSQSINTTITNLDIIPNFPRSLKVILNDQLTAAVKKNLNHQTSDNFKLPSATIRPETLLTDYKKSTNIHFGSFIIDFAEIKHSYFISYEFSKNEDNPHLSSYPIIISCPQSNLNIYNFKCQSPDSYGEPNSPFYQLDNHLPYYANTITNHPIMIISREYNQGDKYLEINIDSCDNKSIIAEATEVIKKWLSSFNLELENLPHQIRNLCNSK